VTHNLIFGAVAIVAALSAFIADNRHINQRKNRK
jgi:hypothetical protein